LDLISIAALIASLGGLAVSVAYLIPVYYDFLERRRNPFLFHRIQEPSKKPVESNWGIRILYPTKPIEECQILWNKTPLPWSDKNEPLMYQKMIVSYGGGIVRVPKDLEGEDAKVRVMNGKKTLRTKRFSQLPTVPP